MSGVPHPEGHESVERQGQYAVTGDRLATVIKGLTSFPGTQIVDECRWKSVLEIWPDALPGLGDSVIVAVAMATRCDAIATFDRKFANKLQTFGLESYF
jgi:hypothetical protein